MVKKRTDEKILDFINAVEKMEARRDIKNGPIKIGNRYYEFEEKDFFEEKLKMYIPKDFEEMSEESRKLKYTPENEPDVTSCNEEEDTYITLKIIDNYLDEEHVEKFKNETKKILKNLNPMNVFYDDGVLEDDSKNIGFLEFKSYTINESIFTLMFFLEFEGKTLMGTFKCPYGEYGEWKECVFQIIRTMKIIKKDKELKANEY